MKQVCFFVLFLLVGFCLNGQCPTGDIRFTTQEQVDDFLIRYPNCTEIPKGILITGTVENLMGLSNIISIGKDLTSTLSINNNSLLTSLEGLENLRYTKGDISIRDNHVLKNLKGLDNLTHTEGSFFIFENPALTSLDGLESFRTCFKFLLIKDNRSLANIEGLRSLESVSSGMGIIQTALISLKGLENLIRISGGLDIDENDDLENLKGLENLTTISNSLRIRSNAVLADIRALENLEVIGIPIGGGKRITVLDNPNLSVCNIEPFCNYLIQNLNTDSIQENSIGCSSREEILLSCEIGEVNYAVFYDQNQNGVQESNELIVPNIPIKIEETGETLVSGGFDTGRWILDFGNYMMSFIDNPNWELTTSATETFEISSNSTVANVSFGIYPKSNSSNLVSMTQSSNLRCGNNISFKIVTKNLGTDFESGTLWFEIDPRLTDFTSDADIINGNTLGWNFQDLHPGHEIIKEVNIQIPTPPTIPVGEILKFKSYFNNGGNEYEHNVEMRCAYDPNDKLVTPDRSKEYQGTAYTTFDEDLFYTVRFQNTGNDVAYDVVIRDTLDANLDPSTFKIISSSHYEVLNVSIEEERNVTFEFKDIFLPDSTTNFDASNGYVSYLIKTKDGLPEETPIQNTASIYFDFNPPIVTNTTENVMVTELPTSSSVDKNQQLDIHLFPNPTDGKIYLTGVDFRDVVVSVYDLTGRLILVEQSGSNEITLPKIVSGMLFLKIETEEGITVKRVFKN